MHLHEGLTQVHSQKKPRVHFGESFALRSICLFSIFSQEYEESLFGHLKKKRKKKEKIFQFSSKLLPQKNI